eukprot:TRINITY_DN7458_c0_g2_i2.p1 TRINITY_DN7458_c0_g2~~TRINITY_DN7458_c0_g2_i2.p1  ORF type:complete len:829 (-),score=129.94 TRINITY_DN7458_c0_g2_i2:32-2518(-)
MPQLVVKQEAAADPMHEEVVYEDDAALREADPEEPAPWAARLDERRERDSRSRSRGRGLSPAQEGGNVEGDEAAVLDLEAFLRQYPIDERARNVLEVSDPEVIDRVIVDFKPKQEGEADYSALVMSFLKRVRLQVASSAGGAASSRPAPPWRTGAPPTGPGQGGMTPRELEEAFLELMRKYPVDEICEECFFQASPEVQERFLRQFQPPREGEENYSALFLSFLKKIRLTLQGQVARTRVSSVSSRLPTRDDRGGRSQATSSSAPACRYFNTPGGCRNGSSCPYSHGSSSSGRSSASSAMERFQRTYPLDERAVEFFLMQSADVQDTVLRDFRAGQGQRDYSAQFTGFVSSVAKQRPAPRDPPAQSIAPYTGPPNRHGGKGGHSVTTSSRPTGAGRLPEREREPPSRERTPPRREEGERAGLGECKDFRRKYPMDERAFEYLISSSEGVRERVILDFVPPREPVEGDYSALVTGFIRTCRKDVGEAPGSNGGLLAGRQSSHESYRPPNDPPPTRRQRSPPRPTSLNDRLDDFLRKCRADERAYDYLGSCPPEVIERVMSDFAPRSQSEDYSPLLMSLTKKALDAHRGVKHSAPIKEVPCRYYAENRCNRDDCPFLHEDPRQSEPPRDSHRREEPRRQERRADSREPTHREPEPPPCKFYLAGRCERGERCTFSHRAVSSRDAPPSREPPREYREERREQRQPEMPMCKFYVEGRCNKGNNCPFSHRSTSRRDDSRDRTERRASHSAPPPSSRSAAPPVSAVLCKFYAAGKCDRGANCQFSHGQDSSKRASSNTTRWTDVRDMPGRWPDVRDKAPARRGDSRSRSRRRR